MNTIIQAHRGASAYRPENTMEAFSLAIEQKADGIELDVHLTKDGEIVVAHDERLERVSDGTGYINSYTLKELRAFDFGKTIPGSQVCRIPALHELFDLVKPTPLMLNIELKTTELLYPELPGKLVSLAQKYGMGERIIYSSFNHYSLLEIRKIESSARIGLLYNLGLVDPWIYANHVKADAIHPHFHVISSLPETVTRCHENGIRVNVWTANSPEDLKKMLQCGVDAIITNYPDIAIKCREETMQGGTANAGT